MALRRLFFAACAASLAWAPSAAAQQAASVTVGGWTIRDRHNHCTADIWQGGNLFAEIAHYPSINETTLLLRKASWASIRERHGDAARLRFSNGRTYDGMVVAAGRTDAGVTTVSASPDRENLLDDFAGAHRVDVSIGGAPAGTLSLQGTRAVAERLRSCAAAISLRQPPPILAPPHMRSAQPPVGSPPVARSGAITNEDYPAAALRAGEQGMVQVRLSVGADGRVTGCTVAESSGSALLDSTTCSIAQRRFRFTPATDANGDPVAGSVTRRVVWRLPAPPPPPPVPPKS